jgi:hypothetical protein
MIVAAVELVQSEGNTKASEELAQSDGWWSK